MCVFSFEHGRCRSNPSCRPKAPSLPPPLEPPSNIAASALSRCALNRGLKVKYRRATVKLASMRALRVAIPRFTTVFSATIRQRDDEISGTGDSGRKNCLPTGRNPKQDQAHLDPPADGLLVDGEQRRQRPHKVLTGEKELQVFWDHPPPWRIWTGGSVLPGCRASSSER